MTCTKALPAAVLAAAALGCGAASAPAQSHHALSTVAPVYLALGDSLPFGWQDGIDPTNPHRFVGYAQRLADTIDLPLVDAACPSEASGSFIDASQPDDGCRAFKSVYPLHVAYRSTQLQYALDFVAAHPRLQLVTLQLGANDLQLAKKSCFDPGCFSEAVKTLISNMVTIVGALRLAGYSGQIIIIDYYNPKLDQMYEQAIWSFDQALAGAAVLAQIETELPVDFVDLFVPFKQKADEVGGDPCDTGLIHRLPDGTCEIHPSNAGYEFIASLAAQAVRPVPLD